jgi:hypothetical protein
MGKFFAIDVGKSYGVETFPNSLKCKNYNY